MVDRVRGLIWMKVGINMELYKVVRGISEDWSSQVDVEIKLGGTLKLFGAYTASWQKQSYIIKKMIDPTLLQERNKLHFVKFSR